MQGDLFSTDRAVQQDARVTPKSMLEWALGYAQLGFSVFPLHTITPLSNSCSCNKDDCTSQAKHPRTINGVKAATTDPAQVEDWWTRWTNANIGIATGYVTGPYKMLVLDFDPRHGGTVEALKQIVPLPPTVFVRTGGGGMHLYYWYDRSLDLRNSASLLLPGVDVRAEGGYIVAPPSMHRSGNRYKGDLSQPIALAPEELIERLLMGKEPKKLFTTANPLIIPSQREEIHYEQSEKESAASTQTHLQISREADHATTTSKTFVIPEGSRNSQMTSIAGSLRRRGLDLETLFDTLMGINQRCCKPPLPEKEIASIARCAGNWEAEETPLQEQGVDVADLLEMEIPELNWVLPGILPEGVTILGGKPKMGKSFLSQNIALSAVSSIPVIGTTARQGGVLYLGMEDHAKDLQNRMRQMLQGQQLGRGLYWFQRWPSTSEGGLEKIDEWVTLHPQTNLVVIDTLALIRGTQRSSSGNMYEEDCKFVRPFNQLAMKHHIAILFIHHLNKGDALDMGDRLSGTNGLAATADCFWILSRDPEGDNGSLYMLGRLIPKQTLNLTFDTQTLRWLQGEKTIKQPTFSRERQEILELMREKVRSLSPKEIADALGKEDTNAVRKQLVRLEAAKVIRRTAYGLYGLITPDEDQSTCEDEVESSN